MAPLTYLAKKDFCSWGFLAFWACSISRRSMKAAVSGLGQIKGRKGVEGLPKPLRQPAEEPPSLLAADPSPHPGAVLGGRSCTDVLNSSRSTSSTSWPRQPPGCVTTDTPTTLPTTSTCRVSWSERCDSTREHCGGRGAKVRGGERAAP
jgi:hypothetical protein